MVARWETAERELAIPIQTPLRCQSAQEMCRSSASDRHSLSFTGGYLSRLFAEFPSVHSSQPNRFPQLNATYFPDATVTRPEGPSPAGLTILMSPWRRAKSTGTIVEPGTGISVNPRFYIWMLCQSYRVRTQCTSTVSHDRCSPQCTRMIVTPPTYNTQPTPWTSEPSRTR